ncbi:MAG: hypothetical protein F4Z03_06975, partial [Gemmatimonadetes bacterium]|nr:hypothetical protein [Gemmatimonadota bacterium]
PPAPTVSVVEVSPNMATVEVGRTQRFVATAKASDGTVISGVDFAWSSSNTAVATINNNGVATAVAAGTANIRATGNGVSSAAVTITVTVAAVSRITIAPSSAQTLMIGEMVTFTATARTAGGVVRDDVSVSWESSDLTVVTITSAGVATAVGAGMATIRATADGIWSAPVTINVAEPPPPEPVVASVTVSPTEAAIETDATQQFSAKALTSDGMEIPDVEFTWSSSDEMVATIDSDGLATGVGAGEAMITATADSVSGIAMLTVGVPPTDEPVVASVTVSPDEAMIEEGAMQQFTAMALTSDGMEIPDVEFAWSSSNVLVAMVDANGLANGVGAGEAMITATADGVMGTATLTVTETEPPPEPMVASVSVSPSDATVKEGETRQFSATAYDSDNMELSGKTFTWSSSNNLIATVNSSGLATGRDAGSVTISATTDGVSGDAALTVEAQASRTASISGTSSYPNTAGSVTFEEVPGGKLKLTITGMNTGGGVRAHLFLYTSSSINWRSGAAPDGARHFGDVTGRNSFSSTFTPSAGETLDSYSHVILHCALVNMPLGSGSF